MLRLHDVIFRAHVTQFVALHAPEILHHVAMKNFRANSEKKLSYKRATKQI